jgi:hypothetical protein
VGRPGGNRGSSAATCVPHSGVAVARDDDDDLAPVTEQPWHATTATIGSGAETAVARDEARTDESGSGAETLAAFPYVGATAPDRMREATRS